MTHPNVDRLQAGFAAFAAGDLAAIADLMADNITWHQPGRSRHSGTYVGKRAVLEHFGAFASDLDSFEQNLHAVLADDEHGVALVTGTATRGDATLEYKNVLVFHLEGGKATEAWVATTDQYAGDEFWA